MDLAALATAVIAQTGRPEKATMIAAAVKATVFKAHQCEYFPQDLISSAVLTPSVVGTLVEVDLPTRFRKFSTIEVLTTSGLSLSPRVFLPLVEPDNLLDFDGDTLGKYFYIQGDKVILKSYAAIEKYRWVWYQNPDLSATDKTTWITNNESYEQDLVDGATAYVYRKLGDSATAKEYSTLWLEFKMRLIADNMLAAL